MVTNSDEGTNTVSGCEDYSKINTLSSSKFRTNWILVFTELKNSKPHPDDLLTLEMNKKKIQIPLQKALRISKHDSLILKKTSIGCCDHNYYTTILCCIDAQIISQKENIYLTEMSRRTRVQGKTVKLLFTLIIT